MDVSNLFRISTPLTDVKRLHEVADRGEDLRLGELEDPHVVASLLVWHVKDMPEPMTGASFFTAVQSLAPPTSGSSQPPMSDLTRLLSLVPAGRKRRLEYLLRFLSHLSQHQPRNSAAISPVFLAATFGPPLCRPAGAYMSITHRRALPRIVAVFSGLIMNYGTLFKTEQRWLRRASPRSAKAHTRGQLRLASLLRSSVASLFVADESFGDAMWRVGRQWTPAAASLAAASVKEGDEEDAGGLSAALLRGERRRQAVARCRALREELEAFERSSYGLPEPEELRELKRRYKAMKRRVRNDAATALQAAYRGHAVRRACVPPPSPRLIRLPSVEEDPDRVFTMTLAELRAEKRLVKRRLKAFDNHFVARHGRLPTRFEKEPMRGAYEAYNTMKLLIQAKEKIERCHDSESESDASGVSDDDDPAKRLAELEAEKMTLQTRLYQFERDFERRHGRKVRLYADIEPVRDEYERYRRLKTDLAAALPLLLPKS
eukprot:PLAT1530.1.p1 GENE.PLAT1530.1~~PLAT1530.1.p1  ORF type:complete len:548 (+),score=171.21 PLAT1530.1:179-1645(+)